MVKVSGSTQRSQRAPIHKYYIHIYIDIGMDGMEVSLLMGNSGSRILEVKYPITSSRRQTSISTGDNISSANHGEKNADTRKFQIDFCGCCVYIL